MCSVSSLLLLSFTLSHNILFIAANGFWAGITQQQLAHLTKGASTLSRVLYCSPTAQRTCDSSGASSYRHYWCLLDNWRTLAKTLHYDVATVNSEFIFSYITDQSESLFRILSCQPAEEPKGLMPLLALLLISDGGPLLTGIVGTTPWEIIISFMMTNSIKSSDWTHTTSCNSPASAPLLKLSPLWWSM